MPLREILHTLLTTAAVAAMQSCESDISGFDTDDNRHVGVLYCVYEPGQDIEVNVYGSASYSDTAKYTVLNNTMVSVLVNGTIAQFAYLTEGVTRVRFNDLGLPEGSELTIMAQSADLDDALTGSAEVMEHTPIERIDTALINNGNSLLITTYLKDDKQSKDYYRLELRARSWKGGQATDVALRCRFLSAAFSSAGTTMWSDYEAAGLFDDTRLARLPNGLSPLNISTQVGDIDPIVWSADSVGLVMRLMHITYDYFTYLQTTDQAANSTLLPIFSFSTVHSNVSGGLGIVGASTTDEKAFVVVRNEENEEEGQEPEEENP